MRVNNILYFIWRFNMNQQDIKPLIEKYTLLENQHDWILKNIIYPRFLENATPALKPRLILKTGQCGAGKSCASQLIASTFAKDIVPVDFSTDMLRHIHPKCDEIRREHYHDYDIL